MSDDFKIDGPPYREPAPPPGPDIGPIKFLEGRARHDNIARAVISMMSRGVSISEALTMALHTYATALDETRRQLGWYMDRHSPVIKVQRP